MKDSKQIAIQNQLEEKDIYFITHKAIIGQPDIYIPGLNLCIFADGCYWHGCQIHHPTRYQDRFYSDFRIKHTLELEGYKVIRIWEHYINKANFDISTYLSAIY